MPYLIDANIFLEVELGQERGLESKEVLIKFRDDELQGVITDFLVDAIVIVMENYGKSGKDIAMFLRSLNGYEGISIVSMSLESKIYATEYMAVHGLDFDDALTYQCMKEHEIEIILSYDAHFDRLRDIKRLTPDMISRDIR